MRTILPILLGFMLFTLTMCDRSGTSSPDQPLYRNPKASIEKRVADLLSRMTLEEKVGQMLQVDRQYLADITDIKNYYLGSILSGGGSTPTPNTPESWADMVDNFQKQALQTRLGIPLIYGIDAVHGHNNVYGAVIFPHNIGMGCTRDEKLVELAARVTAEEVVGTGIRWTFAPCVAVARDERWGRTYESYSESPELVAKLGKAAIKGFQGKKLSNSSSILACAKHYLGDGGTVNGRDQGNNIDDEGTLRLIHLTPYISAIDAEVGSIMASYSSWQGKKMHGSQYWLTQVLRQEKGFKGFVVSDWAGVNQLPGDYPTQLETAINAGIDMIMIPDKYKECFSTLVNLVQSGRISMSRINEAVFRILYQKFALGLFEKPFTDRSYTAKIGSQEHRDVARQCVRKSMVLLKNEGVLPIKSGIQRIHVAGKAADNLGYQCGGWTITWQGGSGEITKGTTILKAIQNRASQSGINVTFSQDGSGASGANLGLVVIGEKPYAEFQGDRTDLALEEEDIRCVENVYNAGVPVVVILISGRPLIINSILDKCAAIVAAWLPGTEGDGVADVLFGDYPFTGKLSFSWPRSMSQIPINVGDENYDPLYPFGYGLSY